MFLNYEKNSLQIIGATIFLYNFVTLKKDINNIKRWFWLTTIYNPFFKEMMIYLPVVSRVMSRE